MAVVKKAGCAVGMGVMNECMNIFAQQPVVSFVPQDSEACSIAEGAFALGVYAVDRFGCRIEEERYEVRALPERCFPLKDVIGFQLNLASQQQYENRTA